MKRDLTEGCAMMAVPNGKQMLLDRATVLRIESDAKLREAERLETLAQALPGLMPNEAHHALAGLVARATF